MKKAILLAFGLLLGIILFAQEPIIVKANKYAFCTLNDVTKDYSEFSEWADCDLILKLDLANDLLSVNNEAKTKIKLLSAKESTEEYDSSCGEKYTKYRFTGIKNDGEDVKVDINWYDDSTMQVYINHGEFIFVYQGKVLTF